MELYPYVLPSANVFPFTNNRKEAFFAVDIFTNGVDERTETRLIAIDPIVAPDPTNKSGRVRESWSEPKVTSHAASLPRVLVLVTFTEWMPGMIGVLVTVD